VAANQQHFFRGAELAGGATLGVFVTIGFGGGIPLVPVDIRDAGRDNVTMQVTLTKDLKDFIVRKVRGGGYTSPGEVVREALRDFRTKDDPAEADSRELAELLLPAVGGRHRPLTARHFRQLRLRARRTSAGS
jgi:Arc/MetJ-type ribon-helix-helix transcriptional regulator